MHQLIINIDGFPPPAMQGQWRCTGGVSVMKGSSSSHTVYMEVTLSSGNTVITCSRGHHAMCHSSPQEVAGLLSSCPDLSPLPSPSSGPASLCSLAMVSSVNILPTLRGREREKRGKGEKGEREKWDYQSPYSPQNSKHSHDTLHRTCDNTPSRHTALIC